MEATFVKGQADRQRNKEVGTNNLIAGKMYGTSMYNASIVDKRKNVAISSLELRGTAASDGY
jgi:hypothetical protein